MQRFSHDRDVFFFEEDIPTDHHLAYLEFHSFEGTSVRAIRPRIPHGWSAIEREAALGRLLDELISLIGARPPILWFYTPMMYAFAHHVDASAVVYDCMDELANFRFAPPCIKELETALMARADVVFTGGASLYEAKKHQHDNIHAFPSSVDAGHFAKAREQLTDPHDQAAIAHPRFGFYGVIDERLDLDLIRQTALARPNYSFVLIGPIAKLSPADLPQAPNIHYLGQKNYTDLPAYLSGWAVALMPFARNEATRFISPTKTPEYLAAGRPVVSTPIADVLRSYGDTTGVLFADDPDGFARGCDRALALARSGVSWLDAVDAQLAHGSWDSTFKGMSRLVDQAVMTRYAPPPAREKSHSKGVRASLSKPFDYLIVGAGFAGAVLAERLASDGRTILICDRRPHIAGNAYDHRDDAGILVHKYGPHIFHTNSEDVFNYLSRFTAWRPYEHRVLAQVGDLQLPIPINRTTLNSLYGCNLGSDAEAQRFLADRAEPCDPITTSRDVVVSQIGLDLYQTFFEGYTRKQWGLDPSELDRSVTARVPTRTNEDDRYFLDSFQAMPLDGYTRMFERILDHKNITVVVDTDFKDLQHEGMANHVIYTGPIDEYFDFRLGRLPYRSLRFHHETHDVRRMLPTGVINFPSENVPHTRMTEYKYLTGQIHPKTSISYEYACSDGDPYYPIPRPENQALYKRYEALGRERDDVTFVGRLGTYKYYNMDQVVGQALATHRRLQKRHGVGAMSL